MIVIFSFEKEAYYGKIIYYTLGGDVNWRVENCAEVWAVRNAILSGAKVDNIVLRTILADTGDYEPLCDQCEQTFAEFIESGRIIKN